MRNSARSLAVLSLEILLGILITVVSLYFFVKIGIDVFESEFSFFDHSVLNFFYQHRTAWLDVIMRVISYLGGRVMVGIGIIFAILLTIKKNTHISMLFLFILITAAGINSILKFTARRPRPNYFPLISVKDYSFPSAHAMDSFVFYTSVSYFVYHYTKRRLLAILLSGLSVILIFLIGVSRVYLGVHYPSDVLAGYFAGLMWFTSVLVVQRTLIFYKLFHQSPPLTA